MGAISYEGTVTGTSNADVIDLTSKPYSLFGYTLSGLGYRVETGDGNDTVYGTEHNDWLDGGAHNDTLYGNDGDDDIYGRDGRDNLFGGRSHDHIYGEGDDDTIEGNGGNDDIDGGAGNDTLYGDNNVLSTNQGGNAGNDTLFGDIGNDALFGQAGTDTLRGGKGRDALTGGTGADTFQFLSQDLELGWYQANGPWGIKGPWYYANQSVDTIKDFDVAGGDIIDITSVLDLRTGFAGTTASDAVSQGYVYWLQNGANTTVYIDPNGSAANTLRNPAFVLAELEGITANQITASHFDVI